MSGQAKPILGMLTILGTPVGVEGMKGKLLVVTPVT
jgi:hypothetical protein